MPEFAWFVLHNEQLLPQLQSVCEVFLHFLDKLTARSLIADLVAVPSVLKFSSSPQDTAIGHRFISYS